MPKSKLEILESAQKFYVAKGYGNLPEPLTAESLAADKAFCDFHKKFETAYEYYAGANYPDNVLLGHLGGIDFKNPVEMVTIPAGQLHTQTQVAWGAKGNYYSTSANTPEMMGIASQGRVFDPNFVPPYLKQANDERIEQMRAKMMAVLHPTHDASKYGELYPKLPEPAVPVAKKEQAPAITDKSVKTYEASEDVRALKSSAKEIQDTWSVPNKTIHCAGGGLQLYVNPAENDKMKQFDLGAHDEPEQVRFIRPS